MKKLFFFIFSSIATFAHAVPNIWEPYFRQDQQFLSITNENNDILQISCIISGNLEKDIHVTNNGRSFSNTEYESPLSFLINNEQVFSPRAGQVSNMARSDWNSFMSALQSAEKIDIYQNNRFLFSLYPRNYRTGLDGIENCFI